MDLPGERVLSGAMNSAAGLPDGGDAKPLSAGYNTPDSEKRFWKTYLNPTLRDDTASPAENMFWNAYNIAAGDVEVVKTKAWVKDATNLLTFVGLFGVIVAAFVIESYKALKPDSADQTVQLLTRLLAAATNDTELQSMRASPAETFKAPTITVVANVLWFCSLAVTLICAFLASLVQQWARSYLSHLNRIQAGGQHSRDWVYTHVYVRRGVTRYQLDRIIPLVFVFLHLAVCLFAVGLVLFLIPINQIVAWFTASILFIFSIAYFGASVLPALDDSCPYRTPLTSWFAMVCWIIVWLIDMVLEGDKDMKVLSVIRRSVFKGLKNLSGPWRPYGPVTFQLSFYALFRSTWEEASRVMIKDGNLTKLLQFVPAALRKIGSSEESRNVIATVSHLYKDVTFTDQLDRYYRNPLSPDGETDTAALQMAGYRLLQQLIEQSNEAAAKHGAVEILNPFQDSFVAGGLRVLQRGPHVRQDVQAPLELRLYLSNVRWILLNQTRSSAQHKSPLFTQEQYEAIDSIAFNPRAPTKLIPLHDETCQSCRLSGSHPRSSDAMAHLAACNALTAISDLCSAEDDGSKTETYEPWQLAPLFDWSSLFPMSDDDRQHAPSTEFRDLLGRLDLKNWLLHGSNFETVRPDSAFRAFVVDTLRPLAQSVAVDLEPAQAENRSQQAHTAEDIPELFDSLNTTRGHRQMHPTHIDTSLPHGRGHGQESPKTRKGPLSIATRPNKENGRRLVGQLSALEGESPFKEAPAATDGGGGGGPTVRPRSVVHKIEADTASDGATERTVAPSTEGGHVKGGAADEIGIDTSRAMGLGA